MLCTSAPCSNQYTTTKFIILLSLLACIYVLLNLRWKGNKLGSEGGHAVDSMQKSNEDFDSNTSYIVEIASSSDAEKFLNGHSKGLMLVYTDWCGHCKNMMPSYGEAAKEVKYEGLVLARIQASKAGSEFMKKYSINGFPTILVAGPNKKEFAAARTKAALVDFVRSL